MYKLDKPFNENEKFDFIVDYNHKQGLKIEDTERFLFALEANEIMGKKKIEIDVPDFIEVEEEYQEIILDENNNPILDEEGNFQYETKTKKVQKPLMLPTVETYQDIVTDEEGNPILDDEGNYQFEQKEHTTYIQSTHKEKIRVPYPIIDPDYEEKEAQKERERINSLTMTKRVLALQLQEYGITYLQLKELIANNEQAELEWDLCERLERSNPLLDLMGAQLGITPEQIDNMFMVANGEEVGM